MVVLAAVHAADQADERHRELDSASAGHRAGRGAAVGAVAAGAGLAGAQLGARAAPSTRSRRRWSTARCSSGRAHGRGADDAAVEDRGAAGRRTPSPTSSSRRWRPAIPVSRSSRAISTRRSASSTSSRSSRCRRTIGRAPTWPPWRIPVPVVPSTLDGDDVMAQIRADGTADRAGRRRIRRHRGHGHHGGPDRGDRRRRPRRARRSRHPMSCGWAATAGACRGCCASTRSPRPPDSAAPEGEYETIGGLVMQELGHIPDDRRSRRAHGVRPGRPARRPGSVAGHGRADGRPAHRPAGTDEAGPPRRLHGRRTADG